MDPSRLNLGDKIAGVSAAALSIFMFYSWYGVKGGVAALMNERTLAKTINEALVSGRNSLGVKVSYNAWESLGGIDLFLLLTVVVTLVAVGTAASNRRADLPISAVVTALGGVSTLLIAYRIVSPPGGLGLKLGVFLGALAAFGVAAGGCMSALADTGDREPSG